MKLNFISIEIRDSILLLDIIALKIVIMKNKRHNWRFLFNNPFLNSSLLMWKKEIKHHVKIINER